MVLNECACHITGAAPAVPPLLPTIGETSSMALPSLRPTAVADSSGEKRVSPDTTAAGASVSNDHACPSEEEDGGASTSCQMHPWASPMTARLPHGDKRMKLTQSTRRLTCPPLLKPPPSAILLVLRGNRMVSKRLSSGHRAIPCETQYALAQPSLPPENK